MLIVGESFYTQSELSRIAEQTKYEKIYLSEYIWQTRYIDGKQVNVDPLIPIAATISEIFSDLLYGEFPQFDFQDDAINKSMFDFMNKRSLQDKDIKIDLLEASVYTSAQGMTFINLFKKDNETYWDIKKPNNCIWNNGFFGLEYFRYFDDITTKAEAQQGKLVYSVQEHELVGESNKQGTYRESIVTVNKNDKYKVMSIAVIEEKSTGLSFLPIVPIYNIKQMGLDVGKSDYTGKEQLFAEIDNRVDQINNILQEHSEPWVAIPAGILDHNGQFNRQNGKMIEKSASSGNSDNSVDFFTWDSALQSQFASIDKQIQLIMQTSRLSPAFTGFTTNEGSGADSGRALRWRSVTTLSALNRKQIYQDQAIKKFFRMLTMMQDGFKDTDADKLNIIWADGLPLDDTELTEIVVKKVNNGLMSHLTGIEQLEEINTPEAQAELDLIKSEQSQKADIQARSVPPISL